MAVWNEVSIKHLPFLRFDPEYYQPHYLKAIDQLKAVNAVPIGTFADVTDGIHGSPEWVDDDGVRYLSAKSVKDNYFVLANAGQISKEQDAANPRTRARINDVLVTTVGTIGNAAVVHDDILPANMDRHLGIIRILPDRTDIDPYYLSTFLNSSFGRLQSLREATGNVQLNLFIEKINTLLVPLGEQCKAIGETTRAAYAKRKDAERIYAEAENLLLNELRLDALDLSHELTYERNFSEAAAAGRYDAQYFHPEKQHVLEQLAKLAGQTIGSHYIVVDELINPPSDDTGELVQNYDLTEALRFFLDDIEPINAFNLGSTKKRFQRGDIVVSRLRSYLKEIAIVETSPTVSCVGSSEFIVLRPNETEVSPELLVVYLRSAPVQKILKWCQDGSNHPRFKEDELISIKLPDRVLKVQDEIKRIIRAAIQSHSDAKQLLEDAKRRVEQMILGEEASHVA